MARAMQASCLVPPPPPHPLPWTRPWGPRGQLGVAAVAIALQLLLIWPPTLHAAGVEPELCVVRALDTRYFTPWLSVSRRAPGCSSHGQLGPGATEVHVVRVLLERGTSQATRGWWLAQGLPLIEIILNATPQNSSSAPLALLLSADRPITWRITANGMNPTVKHTLTVCEECQVESGLHMVVSRQDWISKRVLLRHTKKNWKAITSYTEVQGGNRIELKVGYGVAGEQSDECNTSSRQLSPVASASLTLPQPTQGCLNEDSIGHNAWDVYIVELARHPGSGTQPVQVLLQGEGPRPVPRNVTLVLKAHRPTRWQLGSRGIDGSIVVVSDQQVENTMDGGIVVRSKNLPDGLDALLLSVFAEFGRPVLYAKTERASGVRLLVASREHEDEQLSGDMAGDDKDSTMMHRQVMVQQSAGVPGATFITGLHAQESHAHPLAELRKEMRVSCEPKRMNVSFPRALVARLGVRRLALNDPQCVARSNETHFWVSSHITSCGSISSSSNGATHYSNSVHVRFGPPPAPSDDEDLTEEEASGAFEDPDKDPDKLAVLCKYYPQFPGRQDSGSPSTDGLEGASSSSSSSNHGNIYQMELYRDFNHTNKLNFAGGNAAEVQFDETLYVRAWIEGVVRVQVVTESCWVSNSSDPTYQHVKVPLVRNTCPADLSVKIEDLLGPNARPQHGGFSFQVNKAYWQFGLLYIHCKLGVCTQDPAHARGNLVLCVNQAQHCFRGALKFYDKMVSTAQQFMSRGPLQPVAKRRQISIPPPISGILPMPPGETIPGKIPEPVTAAPPEPEAASVMQGISAEMAAGIALLSFAIGVMLTASMWCIQIKTDPFRQRRNKEASQQCASPALGASSAQASSAAI